MMVDVKRFAFVAMMAVISVYAMSFLVGAITAAGHYLGWDPVEIQGTLFWGCLFGLGLWGVLWRRSGMNRGEGDAS